MSRTDANQELARRDWYYWRLFGTALSFALFGFGGAVLGVLAFPALRLWPGRPHERRARARAVVRRTFRLFIGFMSRIGVLSYEVSGVDRLGRPGQLIVANHPSLIDVVFLLGFTPGAGCIVKGALFLNWFTRGVVTEAGYCSNAATATMIEEAAASLDDGQPLIVFPEGTRTHPGLPLEFQRGAASLAVRSARVVTPVFVRVSPTTLTKSESWYHIPRRRPHWELRVGDDIDPRDDLRGATPPIASRRFNERLLGLFRKELAQDGDEI